MSSLGSSQILTQAAALPPTHFSWFGFSLCLHITAVSQLSALFIIRLERALCHPSFLLLPVAKVLNRTPRCEKCNPGIGKKPLFTSEQHLPTIDIKAMLFYSGPDNFFGDFFNVKLVDERLQILVNSDGWTAGKTCFWWLLDQGELCNSTASAVRYCRR